MSRRNLPHNMDPSMTLNDSLQNYQHQQQRQLPPAVNIAVRNVIDNASMSGLTSPTPPPPHSSQSTLQSPGGGGDRVAESPPGSHVVYPDVAGQSRMFMSSPEVDSGALDSAPAGSPDAIGYMDIKSKQLRKVGNCKVCGDEASGMYFGAMVCVPCKVLFSV